jgi:hypothetical protein
VRPTLDGLNAGEWFMVARALTTLVLLCLLLWFIGHMVSRCIRSIAAHRRAERERHERWLDRQRERQFRSVTPDAYLRERGYGAGCVWPVNDR